MSKDIKLNNTNYTGVSTVQLPTTSGGTASFMDVEEVVIPNGTVEITQNGTIDVMNYAMANVNVASGGSFETGTFVGDGTCNVTLPVTSKKRGFAIMINDYETIVSGDLSTFEQHAVFCEMYDSEFKTTMVSKVYSGKNTLSSGVVISPAIINSHVFNDTSIEITYGLMAAGETFINGQTYTWIAW